MYSDFLFLSTSTAEEKEILLMVGVPAGYSMGDLRSLFKEPAKLRLFEIQDGERIYYDEDHPEWDE